MSMPLKKYLLTDAPLGCPPSLYLWTTAHLLCRETESERVRERESERMIKVLGRVVFIHTHTSAFFSGWTRPFSVRHVKAGGFWRLSDSSEIQQKV